MTKEEMEQQIHDFAEMMYKVGFEDGQKTYKTMYSAGIEDAWNTAQLTIRMWFKHFKQDANEFDKFFELNGKLGEDVFELFFKKYSPSEVLAKISDKEYEDKQKCKECKWDEFRDAQSPVGTPCDSCFEGKNFSQKAPSIARFCSKLNDVCPYIIECEECEVHCSIERAKKKLKGDKE